MVYQLSGVVAKVETGRSSDLAPRSRDLRVRLMGKVFVPMFPVTKQYKLSFVLAKVGGSVAGWLACWTHA